MWQSLFNPEESDMQDEHGYHTMHPTADIIVLIDWREVILIRRAQEPFMEKLAFPGGHVDEGERPVDAAAREGHEEIGIKFRADELELLMILDEPGRDPRPGHDFSVSFLVNLHGSELRLEDLKAASDAKEVIRRKLSELCPADMAFDHWKAIDYLLWWHPEVKRANR
jgi:8-oxo-dGTP diphosphatase